MLKIQDNAVFIADSHYTKERDTLLLLLKLIESGSIKTSQIFFMGDIFDLLIPPVKYTVDINRELIDVINRLSLVLEVFIFEGNHDFVLSSVFKNATVFSLFEQPVLFDVNGKTALLMHGDRFESFMYLAYSFLIRSVFSLTFLRVLLLDFISPVFIKFVVAKLSKKIICDENKNFDQLCRLRVSKLSKKFNFDYIVEGHFHQGKKYIYDNKIYINISSFACNKSFFKVEFKQSDSVFFEQQIGDIYV